MQYPSWSSTCASTWRRMENKISHVWHNYRNQIKNLVFNNKTFHIWLFHTQLTFQFRWKVNISALSTMRPIIKAIDGRKEKEQELGSDGYNYFSSGNVVVLNVQWSLSKYMTGKLKKCFSFPGNTSPTFVGKMPHEKERLPWPDLAECARPCFSLSHQPRVWVAISQSHICPEMKLNSPRQKGGDDQTLAAASCSGVNFQRSDTFTVAPCFTNSSVTLTELY